MPKYNLVLHVSVNHLRIVGGLSIFVVCVLTLNFSGKVSCFIDWDWSYFTLALVDFDRAVTWLQIRECIAVNLGLIHRLAVTLCITSSIEFVSIRRDHDI